MRTVSKHCGTYHVWNKGKQKDGPSTILLVKSDSEQNSYKYIVLTCSERGPHKSYRQHSSQ